MIDIKSVRDRWDDITYYSTHKINKQTVGLFFFLWGQNENEDIYNIAAAVGTKRQIKKYLKSRKSDKLFENKITGKNGLAPLSWVAQSLSDVEEHVMNITPETRGVTFRVTGSDERRQRVYEKFLPRKGYELINSSMIKHVRPVPTKVLEKQGELNE